MTSGRRDRLVVDPVAGVFLLAAAALSFLAARRHPSGWRSAWAALTLGTLLLAADELFDGHEELGAWLHRRGTETPRGFHHLDDLVIAGAAALGAAAGIFIVRSLRDQPVGAMLLTTGIAVLALGAAFDVLLPPSQSWAFYTEELTEAAGAALVALAAMEGANLGVLERRIPAWAKLRHWLLRLRGRQPASRWRG